METMDDFREELEASFKKIRVGDVVTGTVIDVTEDQVIVDLKTYADGVIRKEDLSEDPDFNMQEAVHPGDEITATVMATNDGEGKMCIRDSPGAAEGVIDVAGDPEGTLRKLRQDVLGGDGCDLCQPLGSRRDLVSIPVQNPVSQGLEHSCASVVGGASADAHDESAAALLDLSLIHI